MMCRPHRSFLFYCLQDFKILSFNVGEARPIPAQSALKKLLERTEPDVVALQECPWTVGGWVLNGILAEAFPNRNWAMQEVWESSKTYNTVLYNKERFSAEKLAFERDFDISPQDGQHPELRHALWRPGRYLLLRLTHRSERGLQFYLLNWHGPQDTETFRGKASNARCLLERAALLVQKVGLQRFDGVACMCWLQAPAAHRTQQGMPCRGLCIPCLYRGLAPWHVHLVGCGACTQGNTLARLLRCLSSLSSLSRTCYEGTHT